MSSGYKIPSMELYENITPIEINSVRGGRPPYVFHNPDGKLSPYQITEDGVIKGNSGYRSQAARDAVIICTDANGTQASIVVKVGAIRGSLRFTIEGEDRDPELSTVGSDSQEPYESETSDFAFVLTPPPGTEDTWAHLYPAGTRSDYEHGYETGYGGAMNIILDGVLIPKDGG